MLLYFDNYINILLNKYHTNVDNENLIDLL